MKKILVVVDMQNDFITGSLGTKEAVSIVPKVCDKIKHWDGDIIATRDTHSNNYMNTMEGKHLPVPHCIDKSAGHNIHDDINAAMSDRDATLNKVEFIDKLTFGTISLSLRIQGRGYDYIELVGLCTDICVITNALILKTCCPETEISVDASCCAGVTPESHKAALLTMKMCQINIIGE